MEAELEEERKARSNAQNAKKKLELDIKDMEEQLEAASKVKEDGIKQLKKYQQQVKDIQRDLDEATSSRDQIADHARENEKKLKNLETEFLQMQEVGHCFIRIFEYWEGSYFLRDEVAQLQSSSKKLSFQNHPQKCEKWLDYIRKVVRLH